MTSQSPRTKKPINRWLEPLFCFGILAGLAYALWHTAEYGWSPQPFFYEPDDQWGDWFNTAYWSYDPGTYDTYRTVYPPLSFVFLRLVTLTECYPIVGSGSDVNVGLAARYCDWYGVSMMFAFFVINAIVIGLTFRKHDRKTWIWRTIALALGFPSLEALERGNLIIPTLTCVILAYGPLLRSTKLRWLAIGLAVNFKVYVVATIIPQLLRRRWRWVEGALLGVVAVYLVTYGIYGVGTPTEIYTNLSLFADQGAKTFLDVWFPATFAAMQALLENPDGPLLPILGSDLIDFLVILLPALQHTVQATIIFAAVVAWLRPEVIPRYRLSNLGISLALITSESGGYTVLLTFFFTLLEPWKGWGRKWAIIAIYILCIPSDIPLGPGPETVRWTFFPGRSVIADYKVMLGPFVRPAFFYSIPFALSLVTIREVWEDIRKSGWKDRKRYYRDAPILPGITAPEPPKRAKSA